MLDRRVPLSQTMGPSLLAPAVRWRGSNRFRDSRPAYRDPDRTPFTKTNDDTSVANLVIAVIPSLSPPRRFSLPSPTVVKDGSWSLGFCRLNVAVSRLRSLLSARPSECECGQSTAKTKTMPQFSSSRSLFEQLEPDTFG